MAEEAEVVVPHTEATVVVPKATDDLPVETVTIPKKDWEETQKKAEVSGQNFERLRKEQIRTAELEGEIDRLKENPVPSDIDTERLGKLESELREMKAKQTRSEVFESFPQLKDVQSEFETYLADPENKGMNVKTAAKAFLTEKGLLEAPPRKGLERPTGGDRQPIQQGMSVADAETLRKTDFKKYRELVKKGQLKVNYNS
jgi:hypothetical protein